MFIFLNVCDKFRSNEENELIFQDIIRNSIKINEEEFLNDLVISKILDVGESWTEYKTGCQDIEFFKSTIKLKGFTLNFKYFKTAGFEFIFKEKDAGDILKGCGGLIGSGSYKGLKCGVKSADGLEHLCNKCQKEFKCLY